jgi:L-ascorbate metabolism protein UlaG (beta-lactamase superfamily)
MKMRAWPAVAGLLAGLGLSACGGSAPAVPGQASTPMDPARKAAMVAARQKFFGAENVDAATGALLAKDEVHMVWASVSTFAVNLAGRVVLFDAYIHKEEDGPGYVPATTQDLIDLSPEYVFLGHGHFDHALDGGAIAAATGATIVGTQQHCDQAAAQAGTDIRCVALFQPDEPNGATARPALIPGVCTIAVLHQHSDATPPDPTRDVTNVAPLPVPSANTLLLHPPGPTFKFDATGDEGGDVIYQFRIGHFALTYHDTAGPIEHNGLDVYEVLASLPKTDVQNGSVVGFNMPTNGMRDHAKYVDAIDPKVFVPNHQDFVYEYGASEWIRPALEAELRSYTARPEMRWLSDPNDYLRPNLLRFNVNDPRWVDAGEAPCRG